MEAKQDRDRGTHLVQIIRCHGSPSYDTYLMTFLYVSVSDFAGLRWYISGANFPSRRADLKRTADQMKLAALNAYTERLG